MISQGTVDLITSQTLGAGKSLELANAYRELFSIAQILQDTKNRVGSGQLGLFHLNSNIDTFNHFQNVVRSLGGYPLIPLMLEELPKLGVPNTFSIIPNVGQISEPEVHIPKALGTINGIEIFPDENYTVNIFRDTILISSGVMKGSDLWIVYNTTGHRIEFITTEEINVPTFENIPQNPFIVDRETGEKTFLNDIEVIVIG